MQGAIRFAFIHKQFKVSLFGLVSIDRKTDSEAGRRTDELRQTAKSMLPGDMEMRTVNDDFYLRAVTELGDTRQILVDRDIYSESGMKLVAAGVRISSKLYDRLVMHKLLPSLDKALSVENMLTSKSILEDVHVLLGTNDIMERMSDVIGKRSLDRLILAVRLPSPLAFKLTVAREKYPLIYQHSLLLMITSVYLAHCDRMEAAEQEWMATAALFHDIGLMHVDPDLLAPSHVMNSAERRHLYAHPLTAYLLLSEFPELPGYIADAVLEHHERMDGSGYPRGLQGDKISRYGQVLAVAELAAKAFDSDRSKIPWAKLEMMLKLNSRQYGKGLIGYLNVFQEKEAADASSNVKHPASLFSQAALIAELFEDFNHHCDPAGRDKILDLAQTRLAALRLELFEAGFDPRNPADLMQRFIDDPECMPEYVPLLNEALWQFKSLVLEISRLWPEEVDENAYPERPALAWLRELKQSLLAADSEN